jgi:hypothetical protein
MKDTLILKFEREQIKPSFMTRCISTGGHKCFFLKETPMGYICKCSKIKKIKCHDSKNNKLYIYKLKSNLDQ